MAVSVVVKIKGVTVDPSHVLATVTIRSGRTRADDGLSPSSATIEIVTPDPAGSRGRHRRPVDDHVNGYPRFTGRISEITRAPASDPAATSYTLVAVGAIARLPRIQIPLPLAATNAEPG